MAGGFKLPGDTVEGACGGCAFVKTMKTGGIQQKVFCLAFGSMGSSPPQVKERIEYCSFRRPEEASMRHMPRWMLTTAWTPVIMKRDGKATRTYLPPEEIDEEDAMFGERQAGFLSLTKKGKKRPPRDVEEGEAPAAAATTAAAAHAK